MKAALPYISADIPGIDGELKVEAADFIVVEMPAYEAEGRGEHVYVRMERELMTTTDLVRQLSWIFGLDEVAIGYAGLKDKLARTTQTISLHLPSLNEDEVASRIEAEIPVKVHSVQRHAHKLRRGHLKGNRFSILVRTPDPEAIAKAQAIEAALEERGVANYFGSQRFGRENDNADQGYRILLGKRRRRDWKARLLLSAFQSELFNSWLGARIRSHHFDCLLKGDVAKKLETGGLFVVTDLEADRVRLRKREISYTGPLFGAKMMAAEAEAGAVEEELLKTTGLTMEQFSRQKLRGSRRLARLWPEERRISADEQGVRFSFTLPKGAYATSYLREFMK